MKLAKVTQEPVGSSWQTTISKQDTLVTLVSSKRDTLVTSVFFFSIFECGGNASGSAVG